jgi:hypothetical protein
MGKFEKTDMVQMEQDGIDLPSVARKELEQSLASTVVSRTVVNGVEHVMYTHLRKGPSMVRLAEKEHDANEEQATT